MALEGKVKEWFDEERSWTPSPKVLVTNIRKVIRSINDYIEIMDAMPFEFGFVGSESNLFGEQGVEIGALAKLIEPTITQYENRVQRLDD